MSGPRLTIQRGRVLMTVRPTLSEALAAMTLLVAAIVVGLSALYVAQVPRLFMSSPGPTATATPTMMPTSTSTATPTPTSTATPTPLPKRVIVTWYGEAFRGGPLYCGSDVYGQFNPDDPTTVAMGADGPPCGSRLRLCSDSACIIATIKDKCGGCGPHHLDLSRAGWEALGHPSVVDYDHCNEPAIGAL